MQMQMSVCIVGFWRGTMQDGFWAARLHRKPVGVSCGAAVREGHSGSGKLERNKEQGASASVGAHNSTQVFRFFLMHGGWMRLLPLQAHQPPRIDMCADRRGEGKEGRGTQAGNAMQQQQCPTWPPVSGMPSTLVCPK